MTCDFPLRFYDQLIISDHRERDKTMSRNRLRNCDIVGWWLSRSFTQTWLLQEPPTCVELLLITWGLMSDTPALFSSLRFSLTHLPTEVTGVLITQDAAADSWNHGITAVSNMNRSYRACSISHQQQPHVILPSYSAGILTLYRLLLTGNSVHIGKKTFCKIQWEHSVCLSYMCVFQWSKRWQWTTLINISESH